MYDVLAISGGYLLGSIPFGYLIARLFGVKDIRAIGSGNIGATNVWRAAGHWAGILVLIFDVGKGVLAVLLATSMTGMTAIDAEYLKLICGIAAITGHIFPIYLFFKGGKGVNTALGVMITLLPFETIIALIVFIIAVAVSKYISLGSILASLALFLTVFFGWILEFTNVHPVFVPISFLLVLMIVFTHRSNVKRLLSGTENRFSFRSKIVHEAKNNV